MSNMVILRTGVNPEGDAPLRGQQGQTRAGAHAAPFAIPPRSWCLTSGYVYAAFFHHAGSWSCGGMFGPRTSSHRRHPQRRSCLSDQSARRNLCACREKRHTRRSALRFLSWQWFQALIVRPAPGSKAHHPHITSCKHVYADDGLGARGKGGGVDTASPADVPASAGFSGVIKPMANSCRGTQLPQMKKGATSAPCCSVFPTYRRSGNYQKVKPSL